MKQKYIGIILIFFSILLFTSTTAQKINDDKYIRTFQEETGSCLLDNGTCVHEQRGIASYIFGWGMSFALLLFGLFLLFDKTEKEIRKDIAEVKKSQEEDEFEILLKGFTEDEQKILKAVKKQDGILQSTLRYKTNLSKTNLSLLLKDLEKKNIISREEAGKTKKVYLQI